MAQIDSVVDTFSEFAAWLAAERADGVETIAAVKNGFEGWLKLEFLMWLRRARGLSVGGTNGDAGLEYKVQLDPALDEDGDEWKQCDVWVRATDRTFHYVELKAPFAHANSGKVLRSAGYDFWYMSRLRAVEEKAATGNAIVVGVGFDAGRWDRARTEVRRAAGIASGTRPATGTITPAIRYDVWTQRY